MMSEMQKERGKLGIGLVTDTQATQTINHILFNTLSATLHIRL